MPIVLYECSFFTGKKLSEKHTAYHACKLFTPPHSKLCTLLASQLESSFHLILMPQRVTLLCNSQTTLSGLVQWQAPAQS